MNSSEVRHRNVGNKQNIDNTKLDIIPVDKYDSLSGHYSRIDVEIYNWDEKIYVTLKDNFLIKVLENDDYCIIGRLVNDKIVSITDKEREICEANGYIIGETYKPKSLEETYKPKSLLELIGLY